MGDVAAAAELKKRADTVASEWHNAPYYAQAEEWLAPFWGPDSRFKPLFDRLDHARIVDLACGHGRHSWQMRDWPNTKIMVDVLTSNIEACRKRFSGYEHVELIVNNGFDLRNIETDAVSAVFSYDAMVHFDHAVVGSYVTEIARVLQPGGMALLHHSNYAGNPGGHHHQNPHWRNFMPPGLFVDYAIKAGLKVIEQRPLDWHGVLHLDALTMLRKDAPTRR